MNSKTKIPLIEAIVGWAALGFLILWILEFRRTQFEQSYWLLMLFIASLLGYILVRYKRINILEKPISNATKTPVKKHKKSKS